jgi:hypothetical protein
VQSRPILRRSGLRRSAPRRFVLRRSGGGRRAFVGRVGGRSPGTLRLLLAGVVPVLLTAGLVTGVQLAVSPSAAHAAAATGTGGVFVPLQARILDTTTGTGGYTTPMPAGAYRTVGVDGVAGSRPAGSPRSR